MTHALMIAPGEEEDLTLVEDTKSESKACEHAIVMEGSCVCIECKKRPTCGVEALCKKAGCRRHFISKCLTKELLEGRDGIKESQEARRAADQLRRHAISNSFLLEE